MGIASVIIGGYKNTGTPLGASDTFIWNCSDHSPGVPWVLSVYWRKISASAPFLVTICIHSKTQQFILAHDQVNFQTAEIQPYLSLFTFILFALGTRPVCWAILNLTSYVHGWRTPVDEITWESTTGKLTKILLLWYLGFLIQQIQWEELYFKLNRGSKLVYFLSVMRRPRMSKWKGFTFHIFLPSFIKCYLSIFCVSEVVGCAG